MRLGNLRGRLVLVFDNQAVDVERASSHRFGPDPQSAYEQWTAFAEWARAFRPAPDELFDFAKTDLGAPSPRPPQVFAVGLNYAAHVNEANFPPTRGFPPVFTKFQSSITGPYGQVVLPEGDVDWEVELAVVIGIRAHEIELTDAWQYVAGLTVAQDLSERIGQFRGTQPQYSLAKSHPGFTPLGPWLVTPDDLPDRDALGIRAVLNGESVQESSTRYLTTDVPNLVSGLSRVVTLLPGDVILTGTPEGVGMSRTPPRFLRSGDLLVSSIDGIGALVQTFGVAPAE